MTTKCIKFKSSDIESAKGAGSIFSLTIYTGITVEPITSDSSVVPKHCVFGRSPRDRLVECGGTWKKQNRDKGADCFAMSIQDFGFNANLGKAAHQDDASLQAMIPLGRRDVA